MFLIILLPDVAWTSVDHAGSTDQTIGRNGLPIGLLENKKRKRRGVKQGIPDILFWHRGSAYAIELKVDDNPLSVEQKDFLNGLIAAQVHVKVCRTKDQVFDTLVRWGLTRTVREAA